MWVKIMIEPTLEQDKTEAIEEPSLWESIPQSNDSYFIKIKKSLTILDLIFGHVFTPVFPHRFLDVFL